VSLLDLVAAASAFSACLFLGLRANLLKPKISSFIDAPDWVWIAIVTLSITMGCAGIHVLGHANASYREAMVYAVIALQAGAMLLNVIRNGRRKV
jgi:hypothetical protein